MPYLSREDIDRFAERIIHLYKQTEYPKGHLYYNVDPTRLAEIYDFRIEYVNITRDIYKGKMFGEIGEREKVICGQAASSGH